jgi:VWFA-related protein
MPDARMTLAALTPWVVELSRVPASEHGYFACKRMGSKHMMLQVPKPLSRGWCSEMRSSFCRKLSFLLLLILSTPAIVPTRAAQEKAERPLQTVSEAVVVDLIVRDNRGRPVLDLTPDEVQVFENGVQQEIRSFYSAGDEAFSQGAGEGGETSESSATSDGSDSAVTPISTPPPIPNLVSIVFDQLSAEGRLRARQGALHLLDRLPPNTWVAVFRVQNRMADVQGFTRERETLETAVERATSGTSTPFPSMTESLQQKTQDYIELVETIRGAEGVMGGLTAAVAEEVAEVKIMQLEINVLRFQEMSQRDQQGLSTLHGLFGLVRAQKELRGRKSLLYFSESLQVTSNLQSLYHSLIDEANRNNVSFYGVDARGLMTESLLEPSRVALRQATDISRQQQQQLSFFSTIEEVKLVDIGMDTIFMNYQGLLREMSERTGGRLTANTNDVRAGMEHLAQDMAARYELAYIPLDLEYDGSFRAIEVKVLRPKVEVQAREGYYAVPPAGDCPVLPYEIPMLAALNSKKKLEQDFAHSTAALHFERHGDQLQHTLVLEFSLGDLRFQTKKGEGRFEGHFACLLLIKDSQGEIIRKFSREYPAGGPLENLEAVKKGYGIFLWPLDLDPGSYGLESVVHDSAAGRMSFSRSSFSVEPLAEGIRMSSITLVRQTNPLPEGEELQEDPLRFQSSKVIPNLSGYLKQEEDNPLVLYLNLYCEQDLSSAPQLELEVLKKRKLVARMRPPLPGADAKGRISFAWGFPIDLYEPGQYTIRARASQGDSVTEELAEFEIQ